MKVAVLGGGLAGLYAARGLLKLGAEVKVLEAAETSGGLCRTVTRGRHAWDLGPHAFYSKDPAAMAHFRSLPLRYAERARNVRICHRTRGGLREVAYPFENGLADLPLAERWECVSGYVRAAWRRPPGGYAHLRDWIERGLGPGIARLFMLPYNAKIWNAPLEEISMDLVSGKIDPDPAHKVIRQALFRGSVGRAYQARFIYPEEGGAGAVPAALAADLGPRVVTGWRAAGLERAGGAWTVRSADGKSERADAVVSTIPVPELLGALGAAAPAGLPGDFTANDTFFVAVGLKEGAPAGNFAPCHWVFFAGPECFYRLTPMHNLRGGGPPVLVAEITRKGGAAALSPREIGDGVLRDLLDCGVLRDESAVEFVEVTLQRFTYPIPTLGLGEARRKLEDFARPRNLHLLGRSGRWEYLNADGVLVRAEAFLRERGPGLAAA